ncbi:MAG: Na+/H+ antiporter NhaC family protein [Fusobacterium sp. JB021]|nr:Na+/H+ antiporter NhaC family protein [Fusobacterium sp. JB020]MDP0494468.1 Na+/H+ antiporter NhaC family protein [Fusobacterium sp. JB021]MDP0506821.1 Na+/H+ antiporter NhaC family protein [Fusobacterium sp. JB019]
MKKNLFISFIIILFIYTIKAKFLIGLMSLIFYMILCLTGLKKGINFNDIASIFLEYSKKMKIVIILFAFIGCISACWMSAGTIPALVYFGIKYINPKIFILFSFFLSCFVACIIGSGFATAGIVGAALMSIAKTGNVDVNVVGAAIISGMYFGDRWSPISGSANLISSLTGVTIYENLKNMVNTMVAPFIATSTLYFIMSKIYVLDVAESILPDLILENYNLDVRFVFIPVMIIIIFSFLKIDVKVSMGVSIVASFLIAIFIQQENIFNVFKYMIMGFDRFKGTNLETIIKGGGLISMLNACIVIIISSLLIGILDQIEALKYLKNKIGEAKTRATLFRKTLGLSVFSSMIGFNQTAAIIMTEQVMEKIYDEKKIPRIKFAGDLENTAVLVSTFIPWNSSWFVPALILDITYFRALPFAFYLYLVPLFTYIYYKFRYKKSF